MRTQSNLLVLVLAAAAGLFLAQAGTAGITQAQTATATPIVLGSPTPTPGVIAVPTATPGAATSPQSRTITVAAQGESLAAPDVAVLTLGVQTEAMTATEALAQNNLAVEGLLEALAEAGIAPEDIQTVFVSLQPRYSAQPAPEAAPPEVTGYIAFNTVEVRVMGLDNAGSVLDEAVAAGSNIIQGIRFEVSDPAAAEAQARGAAMQAAKTRAEQLASLAGGRLGAVLAISEGTRASVPLAEVAAGVGGAGVPIQPGQQAVVVELQMTWEFLP